mmetsp:Transcript_25757/g.48845  ORF Transcript_25757/g.48845 Transcript_25757/m.48845 type:complete len:290 (+) Transcript_25757:3630-4499(+)
MAMRWNECRRAYSPALSFSCHACSTACASTSLDWLMIALAARVGHRSCLEGVRSCPYASSTTDTNARCTSRSTKEEACPIFPGVAAFPPRCFTSSTSGSHVSSGRWSSGARAASRRHSGNGLSLGNREAKDRKKSHIMITSPDRSKSMCSPLSRGGGRGRSNARSSASNRAFSRLLATCSANSNLAWFGAALSSTYSSSSSASSSLTTAGSYSSSETTCWFAFSFSFIFISASSSNSSSLSSSSCTSSAWSLSESSHSSRLRFLWLRFRGFGAATSSSLSDPFHSSLSF